MIPVRPSFNLQSNLVNSKSYGLEILFRNIENLNYREVDIKIYNPPKGLLSALFLSNMFCVHKRNVSVRRFFYTYKTYVMFFIDSI